MTICVVNQLKNDSFCKGLYYTKSKSLLVSDIKKMAKSSLSINGDLHGNMKKPPSKVGCYDKIAVIAHHTTYIQ